MHPEGVPDLGKRIVSGRAGEKPARFLFTRGRFVGPRKGALVVRCRLVGGFAASGRLGQTRRSVFHFAGRSVPPAVGIGSDN